MSKDDATFRLALTVPEAAQAIGISERHLRTMLPEIPHLHVGRRVVIPVEALRRWLEDQAKAGRTRIDAAVEEVLGSLGERSE